MMYMNKQAAIAGVQAGRALLAPEEDFFEDSDAE